MIIKFKKTNPDAILPKRNHDNMDGTGDTGYDVYSVEDKVIPARGSAVVDVGLEFAYIEPHYWVKIEGRSGLGFKHDIIPHGGIVDNAFRGNAGVKLRNLSDKDYEVKKGDRIAQFVVYPLIDAEISEGNIEVTDRGAKGFGSSGR